MSFIIVMIVAPLLVIGCSTSASDQPTVGETSTVVSSNGGTSAEVPADTHGGTDTPDVTQEPAEPTAEPDTGASDSGSAGGSSIGVDTRGISFTADGVVARSINAEVVPASPQDDNTPYWAKYPAYVQFTFQDYALTDAFHRPALYVYPVSEFEAMNEIAAEQIQALRDLLAAQPETVDGELPFMPIFNAAQMIHTQPQYVEFENGVGVRYLTQYGQAVMSINNQELFYTFQGMTGDGKYYIAAVLPIAHNDLPTDSSGQPAQDFEAYLTDVTAQLNATEADAFTPNLSNLDALVASLTVADADFNRAEGVPDAANDSDGQQAVPSDAGNDSTEIQ